MSKKLGWLVISALCLGVACSDENSDPNNQSQTDMGTDSSDMVDMPPREEGAAYLFDPQSEDFFALPFPSDTRRKADGTVGYTDWPELNENPLGKLWLDGADDLKVGWGLVGGVFTYWDAPLDPATLPTMDESVAPEFPSVFLINVQDGSAHKGERLPIECKFTEKAGTHHAGNQLVCRSPYGVLRERAERYALVFTTELKDLAGNAIQSPSNLKTLLAGEAVEGINGTIAAAPYQEAKGAIIEAGLDEDAIAGLVVFTTDDPTTRLLEIAEFYRDLPEPVLEADPAPSVFAEYDDYVVIEAFYNLPRIQTGPLPYENPPSGKIIFDDQGVPEVQEWETLRVLITVPKMAQPDGGFPLLFYFHGSGGKALELIHRGARTVASDEPLEGSGPAANIAPYGIAGFATDFALHDTRFPSNPDTTGLKLYNIFTNPRAMIDNFIIAANELTMHARLMASVAIDPALATGLDAGSASDGMIRFNTDKFTGMGQSMGSMLGTPAMTIPSHYDAFINSGSGGTIIEIALKTRSPLYLKPLLGRAFRLRSDEDLDRFDPVLNALQNLFDVVGPYVHGRHVFREPHPGVTPTHVFHPSGLEDKYFSTDSRAGLSTALGVSLADPVLEPEAFNWMKWGGQTAAIPLPIQGNHDGVTAFARQYAPAYEGAGHYVMFDKPEAKTQYACFIKSVGAEAPILRTPENSSVANCP